MTQAANLGFPRIGARRELKKAVEGLWAGKLTADQLTAEGTRLRALHWQAQQDAGIDVIPSNDFSFYDQMLDTISMLGAMPARFGKVDGMITLAQYFAMARGTADAPAMEMTKWFDTNYHYIVPEFTAGQQFSLSSRKPVEEYQEAKALGIDQGTLAKAAARLQESPEAEERQRVQEVEHLKEQERNREQGREARHRDGGMGHGM